MGVRVFEEEKEEDTRVLKISHCERERRREQRDDHLHFFFFVSLAANTAEKREKRERDERRERYYLSERCLKKNKNESKTILKGANSIAIF